MNVSVTAGIPASTGAALTNGVEYGAQDFEDLVELATFTITEVGGGASDLAAGIIETGVAVGSITGTATASQAAMRKLGTGTNDACAGDDSRLSDARDADALKFGSNAALPLDTSDPSTGEYLKWDGSKWTGGTPSSTAFETGTGTVDTTSGTATVSANGGSGTTFQDQLKIGDRIKIGSETKRIINIASQTSLTVNSNWTSNNSNQAFTYQASPDIRPWAVTESQSLSGSLTVDDSDIGKLIEIDPNGAARTVDLPAASSYNSGDSVSFKKVTDDTDAVTIDANGSDTIDGLATLELKNLGAAVTLVSDGVSNWRVVSSKRLAGDIIQRKRVSSAALVGAITAKPTNSLPDGAPVLADGTEVLTTSSALQLTPTSTTSTVRVRGLLHGGCTDGGMYISVTVNDGTSVLGGTVVMSGNDNFRKAMDIPFEFTFTPGSTDQITFACKVAVSGNTFYPNGDNSNNQLLGGLAPSFIEVTEEAI